jgi:hypothetical protein
MADTPWVKLESWHLAVISPYVKGEPAFKVHTVCGLTPTEDQAKTLTNGHPGNEATCENCFRIRESKS